MFTENLRTYYGLPVVDFHAKSPLPDLEKTAVRLRVDFEAPDGAWLDLLESFVAARGSKLARAVVVGHWGEVGAGEGSSGVVEALLEAVPDLPALEALFVGDMTYEECEVSWITQANLTPLLEAWPWLRSFGVRGGKSLEFGPLRHTHLQSLVMEAGGLDSSVIRSVAASDLPALEHLELYLGTSDYGSTVTVRDLVPILDGTRFPRLRYMGLRDSQIADEVARAVAEAPILDRIEVLDLSLGTLGDAGASALLASPRVCRLQKLDIHHHYVSAEIVERLVALGISVDASDRQEADNGDRYVAVAE